MSRIIGIQLILFCFLILTVLLVQCKDKTEVQSRDTESTSAGDGLILSLINNVIKIKDNDFFKSGIESSVRSVFSKPLTSAVYALSMIAGVVAMLAFYESPVSPMPVPPLPDPPVGRFPPEHPIWPPPQKDPIHMSDKKRVGVNGYIPSANSHMSSVFNSPQLLFPQMNMNPNQKYSEFDPSGNIGAYQHLLNMIENRNSKIGGKPNRISGNSVSADISPQVYSSFSVESDPKVLNDSMKAQNLYTEFNPNDRHDSIDIINKFYNQNNNLEKIKEFNGFRKTANSELIKEKDKLNYTLVNSSDPNVNRRLKTKVGES